jgi:hypothetical protein
VSHGEEVTVPLQNIQGDGAVGLRRRVDFVENRMAVFGSVDKAAGEPGSGLAFAISEGRQSWGRLLELRRQGRV